MSVFQLYNVKTPRRNKFLRVGSSVDPKVTEILKDCSFSFYSNEEADALNNGNAQAADNQSTKEDNVVPANTITSVPSSSISSINLSSSESVHTSKALVASKPTQMKQPTLSNRFQKLSKLDCDRITDAISYFIAVGTEPYLIVLNKGFRHLLSVTSPNYKIPSPKVFSEKKIPALNAATKQIIKSKVSDIDYFGLTTDGWTAPNGHKFISLTCSYIEDEWKLECHTLACRELNISNTGKNIKELIWEILAEYKMENKDFTSITTDRGPNGLLAVDLMDINSIPCFAHAVNTKMEEMLALNFIAPTLTKVKGIYAKLSFSSLAKKFLTVCQADLHLPQNKMPSTCKHRWWSEIEQFKFVVANEMALYKFVTKYPNTDQGLLITADDINRMKAVLLVMEPMQKYVTTLGSETIVTASIIPPLIKKLDQIFAKFKYHDAIASFEIRKFFREMPKFFNTLYINNKSHVEMATYLDPRFKGERRQDLDIILEMDMNDVIANKKTKAPGEATSTTSQRSCLPQNDNSIRKEKRKTALEELFEEDEVLNEANVNDIVKAEIDLYHSQLKINMDESPLEWWKGRSVMLPNVSIVAKKYLCQSATAVLSERIFSQGGRVMPKDRYRLTDEHCEQLIFLNMNDDIVPKNPVG